MKKVFFITGLILGVSLAVVAIGYVFSSQIKYVDLIEKMTTISEEDDVLLVLDDKENIVFQYSVEKWREQIKRNGTDFFQGFFDGRIGPDNFVRFTAVSPFPEGTRTMIFAISTKELSDNYSLFFTLNVGTRQLKFFGDQNKGVVGNVVWSPKETHFAYTLNNNDRSGEYLTVDDIESREKEFTLAKEDILAELEIEEEEYFNPEFRALRWNSDGSKLFFMTNTEEEGDSLTWSINFDGTELKRE